MTAEELLGVHQQRPERELGPPELKLDEQIHIAVGHLRAKPRSHAPRARRLQRALCAGTHRPQEETKTPVVEAPAPEP